MLMQKAASAADLFAYKNHIFSNLSSDRHRRYFRIAGITVCLESDLDFAEATFKDELQAFAVDGPGEDNTLIRHHFEIPDLNGVDLGKEFYRKPPWAISAKDGLFCYKGILPEPEDKTLHRLAFFNADHSRGTIYSPVQSKELILKSGWQSLSLMPTDQIWLAPLLADRSAVLIHSAAAIVNGRGLIFVGHSDAGKSTTMELLIAARQQRGLHTEILCDDRNAIRHWSEGWRVHGTWSHGDIADVSPAGAPLKGILFLEQARGNAVIPLTDRKLIWRRLLATLIRPMVTAKWWQQELDILEQIVSQVPCYEMQFDKSGTIVSQLEQLSG